jgi:hypothetical protein
MRNPLRIFLCAGVVVFSLPQACSQQASSSDKDHRLPNFRLKLNRSPDPQVGKGGTPVLTFFLHEKAHWCAPEWARLEL